MAHNLKDCHPHKNNKNTTVYTYTRPVYAAFILPQKYNQTTKQGVEQAHKRLDNHD